MANYKCKKLCIYMSECALSLDDPDYPNSYMMIDEDEFRDDFLQYKSLRKLREHYEISPATLYKIIDFYGLSLSNRFLKLYKKGMSATDIAKLEGIKAERISIELKKGGVDLKRGNHSIQVSQADLELAYKETGTISGVAKQLNISWATGRNKLECAGLLKRSTLATTSG